MTLWALRLALLLVFLPTASFSQEWAVFKRPTRVRVVPTEPVVAGRGKVEVPVRLEIAPGFHINSDKPTFDYMIPTKLEWTSKELKLQGIEYPQAVRRSFSFAPSKTIDVYDGEVIIRSRFKVPPQASGEITLAGKLRYQACDDRACYPPVTVPIQASIMISPQRHRGRRE